MSSTPTPRPVGYYTLTDSVINPKPDRRNRHDWRCLGMLEAGTPFQVIDLPVYLGDSTIGTRRAYRVPTARYGHEITDVSPLFAVLDAAPMVERTPSLTERLNARNLSAIEVLEFLGLSDAVLDAANLAVNGPATPVTVEE
jgi:hypothetical protein